MDIGQKTTPLPWTLDWLNHEKQNYVAHVRGLNIYGPYSASSCGADARLIVRAVNAHEQLLAALEEIEAHHVEINRRVGRPEEHSHTLRVVRAAIAKARE